MGLGSFCVLIILIATFIAWYGNNKALRVNHALDKDLKLPSLRSTIVFTPFFG